MFSGSCSSIESYWRIGGSRLWAIHVGLTLRVEKIPEPDLANAKQPSQTEKLGDVTHDRDDA